MHFVTAPMSGFDQLEGRQERVGSMDGLQQDDGVGEIGRAVGHPPGPGTIQGRDAGHLIARDGVQGDHG